jgi:hypothetical protein
MSDRELLELAAKAAGLPHQWCDAWNMMAKPRPDGGFFFDKVWNPLRDDGDALRLAVQLDLHVHPSGDEVWVSNPATSLAEDVVFETYRGDPYAATRRAIVRAAAEIGRSRT